MSHRNTRILSGCAALLLCAGLSGCRSVPASQPSASPDPAAHLLGLTAEQRMEDYEYLWSTLRDSYPCWGILEREGVEVERIYTTYREMVVESDSDADFYSAIYSALYLLGTNGHLSIIEPEAYFSDYLPAAVQYRREGKTHWAEVLDSKDTQTRYRKLLALEQAANGTDAESSIPGSGGDTPNLTTLLLPGGTAGYLKIDRFPADYTSDAAALEAFYLQCAGCTDLILDLTDNSGGSELYWEQLLVAPTLTTPCPAGTWPWCGGAPTTTLIWTRPSPPPPSAPSPLCRSCPGWMPRTVPWPPMCLPSPIPWNRRQSRVPSADASGCW